MPDDREMRLRSLGRIISHNDEFRRLFGRNLWEYVYNTGPWAWFDWDRLFGDIGVSLDKNSVAEMRKKYGEEGVDLIARLLDINSG